MIFITNKPFITLTLSCLITTVFAQNASNTSTTYRLNPDPTSTRYPNKSQIAEIFDDLAKGNDTGFLSHVSPNVNWTVMGTHPLAGEYHNRTIFAADTLSRLANTQDPLHPFKLTVVNIVGGANDEWSVQELHVLGLCKNGLVFDNRYSWTTRWNTEGIIVEVRAYLDSALVAKAITENESGEYNYTAQRNTLIPGPAGIGCVAGG